MIVVPAAVISTWLLVRIVWAALADRPSLSAPVGFYTALLAIIAVHATTVVTLWFDRSRAFGFMMALVAGIPAALLIGPRAAVGLLAFGLGTAAQQQEAIRFMLTAPLQVAIVIAAGAAMRGRSISTRARWLAFLIPLAYIVAIVGGLELAARQERAPWREMISTMPRRTARSSAADG